MEHSTPEGRLDRMHAAVREGVGLLLVVMHDFPDPDSLAAALAMQRLLETWTFEAHLACGGGIGRPENKAMAGLLDIEILPLDEMGPEAASPFRGAILVDTQPEAGNNSLPEGLRPLVVMDHHPLREEACVDIPVVDVRTEIGATSTMMIDYLDAAGVEVDARLATALYIGIKTDTDSLERDASRADVDAYTRLLPKVDLSIVRKVMHPPLAEEYYELLLRAIDGAVRYGEALVADVGEVEQPDLLSMVSDLLIEAKGVAWALAIGRHDANVYLSLRIRPPRKNAGHLLRRTVEPEGRGGGHALAAGGRVKSTPERVEITAMQVRERFLQVVGMHQEGPRPFCAEARLRRPDPENARTTGEEGTVAG